MPRLMTARYRGVCRICRKAINPGDSIVYVSPKNSRHQACVNASSSTPTLKTETTAKSRGRFVIDWPVLRDAIAATMEKKGNPKFRVQRNATTWEGICDVGETDFLGYSRSQALEWLRHGYTSEGLEGIRDFAPPIREKRRFVYSEEGDEIDLSAAWSGEDNFMTQWTKREVIPGISIEFSMNFGGSVPARVVNDYTHWIAQAVFAIEAAGVDPEISLCDWSKWRWSGGKYPKGGVTQIRVKKEGETVDLISWSAMLSPAAYRTFDFAAIVLTGDSIGAHVDGGIDGTIPEEVWGVKFDPESNILHVSTPNRVVGEFPESLMTQYLRDAIETLKVGS